MAKKRKLATARGMSSERASVSGLPVSMRLGADAVLEVAPRCASARRSSSRERSAAGVRDQAGNARRGRGHGASTSPPRRVGHPGMDRAGRRLDVVEVRAVERLGRAAVDVVGEDGRHVVSARAWANRQASWNELYIGTGATRMMSGSRKSATIPGRLEAIQPLVGVGQPQAQLGATGRGIARREDLDAARWHR